MIHPERDSDKHSAFRGPWNKSFASPRGKASGVCDLARETQSKVAMKLKFMPEITRDK